MIVIRVDDEVLRRLGEVFIYYAEVRGVTVKRSGPEVKKRLEEVSRRIRASLNLEALKSHPVVRAYRDFFWRIDVDPTKTRPAGEALVRRILSGRRIPLINNVVDAGNIASIETRVPIGIYDLSRVKGSLTLRLSREGEEFMPIGKPPTRLRAGLPVLADDEKILHLFPHRDSEYTKVTESTRDVLALACGVPGVEDELVEEALRKTTRYIVEFAGGTVSDFKRAPPRAKLPSAP